VEGVFISFWCELAPPPGLLWYDSYASRTLGVSTKHRPSFLSGKRRGSSNRVYDFKDYDDDGDDAEGGDDDFYALGGPE